MHRISSMAFALDLTENPYKSGVALIVALIFFAP
jgi:hypothetical protein